MKKIFFALLLSLSVTAIAQNGTSGEDLYREGMKYLNGLGKPVNPQKALTLFWQSASYGNAQAMNALGNMHFKGVGIAISSDSALHWYKRSASNGCKNAMYNLGRIYKDGDHVQQNFATAAYYYKQGSDLKDRDCTNILAYLYYKGLGVHQDYNLAFNLFSEIANRGDATAMYYLGLCYRNGYGTTANSELSKSWLSKAAQKNEKQALHELEQEPLPENMSVISRQLEQQLEKLKNYSEKFQAQNSNNNFRSYSGYVIYYDWSGKFVHEIQLLKLSLQKFENGYKGIWREGNISPAQVSLNVSGNIFSFDPGSSYTRVNHYSNRTPEKWQFNNAKLELEFLGDSISLSGYVQFYSTLRKEPGKPLQIILKKIMETGDGITNNVNLNLFPNPANSKTTVQFTIGKSAKVAVQITQQNGSVVYAESGKLIPPGTYNYSIQIDRLAAGVYNVRLITDGKISGTKQLIKQ